MKTAKQLFIFVILITFFTILAPFVHAAREEKVYYFLHDNLGGISAVTDEEGNIVENRDYLPYGEGRLEDNGKKTDYGFTGKEQDPETELYYYGARYYDPAIGRFISQDPWAGDLTDPQTLNKYSYVLNNPLKFIDPTGALVELVARRIYNFLGTLGGTHTFLRITPDNPADFQNVSSFTIGAYADENGTLVKEINHPNEANIAEKDYRGTYTIESPEGLTDTEFINGIMDASSRYEDDRAWSPTGANSCNDKGNCNNFTTGLLEGAGVPPEVIDNINPEGANPGLGTPLPEMLDPSRTNRAQWQEEFTSRTANPVTQLKQVWDQFKEKVKDFFTPEKKEDGKD